MEWSIESTLKSAWHSKSIRIWLTFNHKFWTNFVFVQKSPINTNLTFQLILHSFYKPFPIKTHISFTFHCPIFPVLFLKPPNLVFHYFPSILSMHKHAYYVNHLIFCVHSFLLSSCGRYIQNIDLFFTSSHFISTNLYYVPTLCKSWHELWGY